MAGFPCGPSRFYRLKEQLQYFQDQLKRNKEEKEAAPNSQQPVSETIQMIQRMMNPKSTSTKEPTVETVNDHSVRDDTLSTTNNEDIGAAVSTESTAASLKVTPSSNPTTFTPELLKEMIALDARGELKTTASRKALNKKRWSISL